MTPPSLTASGAGRSRSPRASKTTTPPPPPAAVVVTGGDAALRAEGHARDVALPDRQRRRAEPLPARVEDHHAAAVDAGVTGGDPALRAEGHARDAALLDRQRRRADPLPARVEDHHAAAAMRAADDVVTGGDLAFRAEGHARDAALGDREDARDLGTGVGDPALLDRRRRGANGLGRGHVRFGGLLRPLSEGQYPDGTAAEEHQGPRQRFRSGEPHGPHPFLCYPARRHGDSLVHEGGLRTDGRSSTLADFAHLLRSRFVYHSMQNAHC